jgi:hypothetical protein
MDLEIPPIGKRSKLRWGILEGLGYADLGNELPRGILHRLRLAGDEFAKERFQSRLILRVHGTAILGVRPKPVSYSAVLCATLRTSDAW